jgi:hypothetical protein
MAEVRYIEPADLLPSRADEGALSGCEQDEDRMGVISEASSLKEKQRSRVRIRDQASCTKERVMI